MDHDNDTGSLLNLSLCGFGRNGWGIMLLCLIFFLMCVLIRFWFESWSYSIAKAGLELTILEFSFLPAAFLPQAPKSWDYRWELLCSCWCSLQFIAELFRGHCTHLSVLSTFFGRIAFVTLQWPPYWRAVVTLRPQVLSNRVYLWWKEWLTWPSLSLQLDPCHLCLRNKKTFLNP